MKPGRKSVVLITVDCLRADHVGFMGYQHPTTPFLDALAAESFVVPTAIVGGAPTYYSFPSILGSRYPLALGRDVLGLAPGEPSLSSALKGAGYATAHFGAANPYLASRFGYAQGFDLFQDSLDQEPAAISEADSAGSSEGGWSSRLNRQIQKMRSAIGPLGSIYDELYFQYCQRMASASPDSLDALRRFPAADVIVDQALAWLASIGDSPFFLWLHLMDPHSPYYPTEKALELMGDAPVTPFRARYLNSSWNRGDLRPKQLAGYRDEIISLYDAGIRWVDAQTARLVESLRSASAWDNCIFALTADHGEEFLEHGGRYHPPSNLREELIHVPLLLRVPGIIKKKVSDSPLSHLHLAPTLLAAADVAAPSTYMGRSLLEELRQGEYLDDVAISECVSGCTNPFLPANRMGPRVLSVRERRFKLVLHFDPETEILYDLQADPHELSPLPPHAEKPVRRRLLDRARAHIQGSLNQRDADTRLGARLRELRLEWNKSDSKVTSLAS
jgi:arylsulfatase A-like enzyme